MEAKVVVVAGRLLLRASRFKGRMLAIVCVEGFVVEAKVVSRYDGMVFRLMDRWR